MKYVSVAEAREMDGLRVALTVQAPGTWAISARAVLNLRNVPFTPVRQDMMQPNEELLAWTGRRNSPVAVYNDEPAIDGWLDIVNLAERLGSGASLFPEDYADRALAIGFSAEICAHNGFGWARRNLMSPPMPPEMEATPQGQIMCAYGAKGDTLERAMARSVQVMRGLARQLDRQRAAGSPYLVGSRLSLCDVHWACFSILVSPLAQEDCAINDQLRAMFEGLSDAEREALDPILIGHRDMVWRDHIGLPLEYLPDDD